ncbi:MAG TPA: flagellar filament capping protein FliD [Tepidiformaceae bacterium]|nr:flagellar filament capping protein FliD [Tepidiformaceae bacterium]
MSSPIRIGNFFSTFDTESVISQLTALRQGPIRKLEVQRKQYTAQKAALSGLSANFSALLLRAKALTEATSVSGKTSSVDGTGVAAAATPSSALGTFSVNVTQLATGTTAQGTALTAAVDQVSTLSSSNFNIPVSAGTFTIKTATGGTATIAVDPATQSLDDVVAAINATTVGITASVTNDTNGRANRISMTSTQGAISLGAGGDTSNFLQATNLVASPGTTTRTSTFDLARLNPGGKMATASFLGGPPAAGPQSFSINGVQINYDTAADSLNDVIGRINASTAGVTARYDGQTDTIKLTQTKTGSLTITLADNGGGDFLAKTGLLAAAQTMGTNAQYAVDGGATQYSDSNTVTVNGSTLTLSATTTTPAKVTVSQDTASAVTAVKNFVAEYNGLMDAINAATKNNGKDTSTSGSLVGDSSLAAVQSSLRSIISSAGSNLTGNFATLGQIGLSFGAVGSAVGSTTKLVLDEAKFKSALASDPASVQAVLSQQELTATLAPAGTGSLASMTGTYSGTKQGTYAISDDGLGTLTATFTPADGGPDVVTTGAITAGGTNSTLIPGMTLQAGPALQAGTHSIAVGASRQSVIKRIQGYLEVQAGVGGALAKRQETYDKRLADITKRQDQIQSAVDKEMEILRRKFTAMEQAQARAQTLTTAISNAMAKITASDN